MSRDVLEHPHTAIIQVDPHVMSGQVKQRVCVCVYTSEQNCCTRTQEHTTKGVW